MTTAEQLDEYMKKHNPPLRWLGVFPSDKLPTPDLLHGCCFIANYDPSYKSGSHWVGFRIFNNTVEYFDSYGEDADTDNSVLKDNAKFKQYIRSIPHTKYLYNPYDFQSLNSDVCGLYAVYFCLNGLPDNPPQNPAWDRFYKAPKAFIRGNDVKLDAPLAKANDTLIQTLVPIKTDEPMGIDLYGQGISKSEIHSVVFNKQEWTPDSARMWLSRHNYHPIKRVDITENTYRYRIKDPRLFKRFTTEVLPSGINLVLGWHR